MKYSVGKYSIDHYSYDPTEPSYEDEFSGSLGITASIITKIITSHSATLHLTPSPTTKIITSDTATLELEAQAVNKTYIDLDSFPISRVSIGKGISDQMWDIDVNMDDEQDINTSDLKHVTYAATDHNGVSRTLFTGVIPKSNFKLQEANKSTGFNGYDHAFFLQQYVPAASLHNTATVNPADIIIALLGGTAWETTTGIEPYNIDQVVEWGDTLNSKVFDFDLTLTKWQASQRICNYTRYMFVIKNRMSGDSPIPSAYFIHEDNIDTDLDLPSPVTFTWPDRYVEGTVNIETKGEEKYNRVTVIGRDNSGSVFTATEESTGVENGDELPVEYIENSGSWTTQAQVNARAIEIYGYYSTAAVTYKATLIDRLDLELYQKIYFSGFSGVPETAMRIIQIRYIINTTNDGVTKRVEITFTDDGKWNALRRMYRYQEPDPVSEIESVVYGVLSQTPGPQIGTVDSIDGQECDVTLESGQTITTRCV